MLAAISRCELLIDWSSVFTSIEEKTLTELVADESRFSKALSIDRKPCFSLDGGVISELGSYGYSVSLKLFSFATFSKLSRYRRFIIFSNSKFCNDKTSLKDGCCDLF